MTRDLPTAMHTQWKINVPGAENWSKKIKVPLHELIFIDINISSFDKTIGIKIEKSFLLVLYKLKIVIFVLNNENRKIFWKHSKNLFESSYEMQKFESCFEKTQLVDKSLFHLPYSFTLVVEISASNETSALENDSPSNPIADFYSNTMDPNSTLKDLRKMLLNDKHSDVKLRTRDKIIPAHKCILSARSPVFSTMFDQDMLETQTGAVDLPDVETETLQSFIEFLYTDTISNTDWDEVLRLMMVADKYQVDILKKRCSRILMNKFSLENIFEIFSVAELVNQSELKQYAIDFIKSNKNSILLTPVWSEWMIKNMELANEILMKLIVD